MMRNWKKMRKVMLAVEHNCPLPSSVKDITEYIKKNFHQEDNKHDDIVHGYFARMLVELGCLREVRTTIWQKMGLAEPTYEIGYKGYEVWDRIQEEESWAKITAQTDEAAVFGNPIQWEADQLKLTDQRTDLSGEHDGPTIEQE